MKNLSKSIALSFILFPVIANAQTLNVSAVASCPNYVTYENKKWMGDGNTIFVNPDAHRVSCHYFNNDEPEYVVVGGIEADYILDSLKEERWAVKEETSTARVSARLNLDLVKVPRAAQSQ